MTIIPDEEASIFTAKAQRAQSLLFFMFSAEMPENIKTIAHGLQKWIRSDQFGCISR